MCKRVCSCVVILFSWLHAFAQIGLDSSLAVSSEKFCIKHVYVQGNRRTKDFIINRQLTFHKGDSLTGIELSHAFEISRQHLLNISLFLDATINALNVNGHDVDVNVTVYERWYTLPGITLDIYDRNFNTWYVEHEHDWRRVQYGIRFLQQNMRGRDEDLILTALFGYAQRFDIGYRFPYINRQLNKGLRFSAFFARQRSIAYNNDYNKERVYWDNDRYVRNVYGGAAEFTFKPGFHFRQQFALGYNHASVRDTIIKLNNDYFGNANRSQQFLSLRATTYYDTRDWMAYPFKGYYVEGTVLKTGLGVLSDVNVLSFVGVYQHYFQTGKRTYFSYQLKGKYSVPVRQPYYNLLGLGYRSDYVSGYEYYVVDGHAFALAKLQFKYRLVTFRLPMLRFVRRQNVMVPFYVLAKTFADAGYVDDANRNNHNALANTLMAGSGVGIDVATAYDFAVKVEYSVNRKGENGLFLHFSGTF